jgi:hypothetical protein
MVHQFNSYFFPYSKAAREAAHYRNQDPVPRVVAFGAFAHAMVSTSRKMFFRNAEK